MASVSTAKIADLPKSGAGAFIAEKQTLVLCLLLAVATLAVYNPITKNGFINVDDAQYITHNSHVRSGLSWETVKWAFTTFEAANWHPLTWISHALDCQMFNLNPAGHHYVGLLLHATNVVILFLLLQRATGFTWRSAIVAALFALHPVNVESVAWAAERKTLLSAFFFLLALGAYTRYARAPGIRRYLWVTVLYAFGLMAKPQIVTFPFILLLWDYWPLRRINPNSSQHVATANEVSTTPSAATLPRLVLEKIPWFVLSAISALITLRAQHAGYAVRTMTEFSFRLRLENAVISYLRYVQNAFWPLRLSPMYPHLETPFPTWQVLAASLALLLVTVAVFYRSRQRYLVVGWLFFLGSLVPMIGIVQVGEQAMADRYAYLPLIGLFLMVAWSLADLAGNWRIPQPWLAVPAGVVLISFSIITHHQISYWRDSQTLWTYALHVTDKNFMAEDNLAQELATQGHVQEAINHFRIAEDLHAYEPSQLLQLGLFEFERGFPQDAIGQYERVLRNSSDPAARSAALDDLGLAYLQLRSMTQAREAYEAASKLDPDKPETLTGLGLVAQKTGDLSEAVRLYSRAVEIRQSDVGYLLLQRALEESGHPAEAKIAYQRAVSLSQDLNEAERSVTQLLTP